MQWRNTDSQYGLISQLLHWGIVALVATQLVLGMRAADLPFGLARLQLLAQHKSFGMTVLMLIAVRLAWRLGNQVPASPDMRSWARHLAHLTHWGFYLLLVAIPISGWILSSASNLTVSWFQLFTWPDLVEVNTVVAERSKTLHHVLVATLVAMIVLHIAAAVLHQFVWRDGLILRMLPKARWFGSGGH